MSADPKSLATLAISTSNGTKRRRKSESNSQSQDQSSGDQEQPDNNLNFGSTDEFIAGWTAAFINTTALFPINKLIFRQMAGGHGTQVAADQMKKEGLRYLYRGILPPLIQKMFSVSIMFGSFGHYKQWADTKFINWPPVTNLALAAILTGTTEAVLTPLERVQMLLQDTTYHKNYKNTIDALVKLRQFGLAEYYRGLSCVLVRNGPSNILFFGLRDEIKRIMPSYSGVCQFDQSKELTSQVDLKNKLIQSQSYQIYAQEKSKADVGQLRHKDSMLHNFLSGAILGMFISTLFYPLSVVRTRMQTRAPGTEFLSIVKAFNAVYSERDRKFTRLFHGCLINVLRQFVSWGIINCSYEFVLDQLHKID